MEDKFKQELRAFLAGVMPGKENALVFGEGPLSPRLMLIGEAPGEQESLQGRPFVGKAGKNLDRFLELAGLRREEIYISNAVKFRPTKTGASGRVSNRPPTRDEIALFRPWLLREISEVKPGLLVTLGNVPLKAVTNSRMTIGDVYKRQGLESGFASARDACWRMRASLSIVLSFHAASSPATAHG